MISNFKFFVSLFLILFIFVVPVSAFDENFNDGEILSDWMIESGTWTVINTSSIDGADDYYATTTHALSKLEFIDIINKSVDVEDITYISYNFKITQSVAGAGAIVYASFDTGKGFTLRAFTDNLGTYFDVLGVTYTDQTISHNVWYTVKVYISGSNLQVDLCDVNGVVIDSQTTSYTETITNIITLQHYLNGNTQYLVSGTARFDNIILLVVPPSVVGGIEWGLDEYTEGDLGYYSWIVSNDVWYSYIFKYRIQLLKDGFGIEEWDIAQIGTNGYNFEDTGVYTLNLQKSVKLFTDWVDISTDSVYIKPEVDSLINAESYIPVQQNFTITYSYGFTPTAPAIQIRKYDEFGGFHGVGLIWYDLTGNADAQMTYTINGTVFSSGTYQISLMDASRGEIKSISSIANFEVRLPEIHVPTSFIESGRNVYSAGDTIYYSYAVDDTNYSNSLIFSDIYSYDNGISHDSHALHDQMGNEEHYVALVNNAAGNYSIRLSTVYSNGSIDEVLDYYNITLTSTNAEGYSLSFTKNPVGVNEKFGVMVTTETESNLVVLDHDYNEITSSQINGTDEIIDYRFSTAGFYRFRLFSSNGNLQKSGLLTVLVSLSDDVDDDDELSTGGNDVVDNFKIVIFENFGSSPAVLFIVGVFISALCAVGFAALTKHAAGGVVGAILGLGIAVSIGFISMVWAVMVVIIAGAVVAVTFKGGVG